MTYYKAQLNKYLGSRKVISTSFFTSVENAQHICEDASKSLLTYRDQNAAQATFKAQIKTASEIHSAAIKALAPRPIRPIVGESIGVSHETHKIAPYRIDQGRAAS